MEGERRRRRLCLRTRSDVASPAHCSSAQRRAARKRTLQHAAQRNRVAATLRAAFRASAAPRAREMMSRWATERSRAHDSHSVTLTCGADTAAAVAMPTAATRASLMLRRAGSKKEACAKLQ